jgi:hypothetical protein
MEETASFEMMSRRRPELPNIVENTLGIFLDAAHTKIESQQAMIEQLDQKCSVVLGFSLVSVVEVLGFLLLVAAEHVPATSHEPFWVHSLFYIALGSLIIGSLVGLLALRGNPTHCFRAHDFRMLRDQSEDPEKLIGSLTDSAETAITRNWQVIRHKRMELKIASGAIAIAVFLYAILVARIFSSRF